MNYMRFWLRSVRKRGLIPCLFCLVENPAKRTYCGGCRRKLKRI